MQNTYFYISSAPQIKLVCDTAYYIRVLPDQRLLFVHLNYIKILPACTGIIVK